MFAELLLHSIKLLKKSGLIKSRLKLKLTSKYVNAFDSFWISLDDNINITIIWLYISGSSDNLFSLKHMNMLSKITQNAITPIIEYIPLSICLYQNVKFLLIITYQ